MKNEKDQATSEKLGDLDLDKVSGGDGGSSVNYGTNEGKGNNGGSDTTLPGITVTK